MFIATVLCCAAGAVLAVGQCVVVRHRAGAAADLAALAASATALEGEAPACACAARVAAAHHTRLAACAIHGEVADVTVAAALPPLPALLAGAPAARSRSRAGPPALADAVGASR